MAIGSPTVAAPASATGVLTVIAHRADAKAAPESTKPAFRSAISKDANAIEMDVRFTRTKYPVVLHDATLDRTTNCSGSVSARSRTELRRCDAGSWFSPEFRGTRGPTLDSALRTVSARSGSARVLLHVKQFPKGVRAKRVMNDVGRHGMTDRVVIIADTAQILRKMRSAGFTELGLVFGSEAGWRSGFEYLLPYNPPERRRHQRRPSSRRQGLGRRERPIRRRRPGQPPRGGRRAGQPPRQDAEDPLARRPVHQLQLCGIHGEHQHSPGVTRITMRVFRSRGGVR